MKILDIFKKETKKIRSFDFSVREQLKIVEKAARQSNKDQMQLSKEYDRVLKNQVV